MKRGTLDEWFPRDEPTYCAGCSALMVADPKGVGWDCPRCDADDDHPEDHCPDGCTIHEGQGL